MTKTRTPASLTGRYTLEATLNGHNGAILCLATTDDGSILASGGTDGVRLWNLVTKDTIHAPAGVGARGATTSLIWIRREDEPEEALFYGTQNGHLVCWRQVQYAKRNFEEMHCVQLANPSEISGLAFDAASNYLATSNRNSLVQLFMVDSLMELRPVFSITIDNCLPKMITFGHMSGDARNLLVFSMHDGRIHTLRGSDGKIEHTRSIGGVIGNAVVNMKKGVFCVDDSTQGVALFRLETGARIRTFPVAITKSKRPRQIDLAEDCSVVVSGSDHGIVYVFDRRTGETIDQLQIDPDDWVQTVKATEINNIPIVLAARSRDVGGENAVFIWKRKSDQRQESDGMGRHCTFTAILKVVLHALMFAATLIFLYQNYAGILTRTPPAYVPPKPDLAPITPIRGSKKSKAKATTKTRRERITALNVIVGVWPKEFTGAPSEAEST